MKLKHGTRIGQLEAKNQARREFARAEYQWFWAQFTYAELEQIASGDEAACMRAYDLGAAKMLELSPLALTDDEKRELAKIEKEIANGQVMPAT